MNRLVPLLQRLGRGILLMAVVIGAAPTAHAQLADHTPKQLENVGVTEHLGDQLPLDLEFVDENGRTVQLGDYFEGQRPVILSLNYYRCPMLCGLQLNGLADGMGQLDWTPGDQFDVVTVSIDPSETPQLAKLKKQGYLKKMGRPAAAAGWHFLTGHQASIHRLAEAVGFRYSYDAEQGQFAHAAAAYVCTPKGKLARYLYGIDYPAKTLRLALLEGSEGKIGSPIDQLILYCYCYNPSSRTYTPVAMNIMRLGGGLTVLFLGLTVGLFWVREARRSKRRDTA